MSAPTATTSPAALATLDDLEVVAEATGILMVRFQLTHTQARTALATRAQNAGRDLRSEAEAVIAEQDAAARRWCGGPAGGVVDGRALALHGSLG